MIVPYDPFGLNRMVYTIQNACKEVPEMPYEDGAKTVFLYTKGTEGNPPEALKQLLHYMEHTTKENAANETLLNIHKMVETVKQDKEVTLEYMKIFEREQMLLRRGVEQGQQLEFLNTQRERQRADAAEARADAALAELQQLKALLSMTSKE